MLVCNKNNCGLVVLLKTKLKVNKLGACHRKFFSQWKIIENSMICSTARVWVLWRAEEFEVKTVMLDTQFIHLQVHHKATLTNFYFTVIYAANLLADRLRLWEQLRALNVQDAWRRL